MTDVEIVLITAPDEDVARRLARALVGEHLAACVNLVPGVTSVYRWEGAVEEEHEWLLIAKGDRRRRAELVARVRELHPHDEPEVVAVGVSGGSESYLNWVLAEARGPARE